MMTTDKAYESLQTRKTEFDIGVCTFNGCTITITERESHINIRLALVQRRRNVPDIGDTSPSLMAEEKISQSKEVARLPEVQVSQLLTSENCIRN